MSSAPSHVLVVGAGPAGLTASVQLCRRGVPVTVLEKGAIVGGIARTESYKGYHFDIGGHRFFTKIGEVDQFWHDLLGAEFITRPRVSRIFYEGRFFDYPLKPLNALSNLGLATSVGVVASYLRSRLFPHRREDTFEEWVSNRFGRKLYRIFFKTYTEKVWGIPCSEIRAEWAAQRIKDLNLPVAVWNALFGSRRGKEAVVQTLIEQFEYPPLGPGQMWRAAADFTAAHGGLVHLGTDVVRLRHAEGRVTDVVAIREGTETVFHPSHVVSSMPLAELVLALDPPPGQDVVGAARGLGYRDFLTVVLIVGQPNLFPDNWTYIHSPKVRVGRIQNFKNWSPQMVPDPAMTSLGLEYFCTEGDEVWSMTDADLLALGRKEMAEIGLVDPADVVDGTVVRQPKAYPVYSGTYAGHLRTIRDFLATFDNLQTVGRNGLHKYNNQDHSMLTAMLAVRNLFGERHDLWEVNTERSYHEERRSTSPES